MTNIKRTELVHSHGKFRSILGQNPWIKIDLMKWRTKTLLCSAKSNFVLPQGCSVKSHLVSTYEHIISNHWYMYLKINKNIWKSLSGPGTLQ